MEQQVIQDMKISSKRENINLIDGLIDQIFEKNSIDEDHYGNVLMAMTEAVTNGILHGNKEDQSKYVYVTFAKEDNRLCFVVRDEGDGFKYDNLPDPTAPENLDKPSGRGIFLMKSLADDLEFEENGKVVKLYFNA